MGIATILLDQGLITSEQLEMALMEHRETGERLDQVLIKRGMVRDDEVTRAIGEQFDLPVIDLTEVSVTDEVLKAIPPQIVFRQRCDPIERRPASRARARCAGLPTTRRSTSTSLPR